MDSCFLLCFQNDVASGRGGSVINVNEILHRMIAEFQRIEQVTAIAMVGSKFCNYQNDLSDISIQRLFQKR